MSYAYAFVPATDLFTEGTGLLDEMSELYSEHYGKWSQSAPFGVGKPVKLTASRIKEWLKSLDSSIAYARCDGRLIGYAIAVQTDVREYGMISWITQFVIHESHRNRGVGKSLLFSIWGFTDHFGWGLVTVSPYAVRALEKATRRRCDPARILRNHRKLLAVGAEHLPYIKEDMEHVINKEESRINTAFFLDHSELNEMLTSVTAVDKPWKLGGLPEGWEWCAFTFQDQDQLSLTASEVNTILEASDDVVKQAYSRMLLNAPDQRWAKHTPKEVDFILAFTGVGRTARVSDFGCGVGQHSIEISHREIQVIGIDYVPGFIQRAKEDAAKAKVGAAFQVGDSRSTDLGSTYDLVLCLYDVIGTYADNEKNRELIRNLFRHTKVGGWAVASVMNFTITEERALNKFELEKEPNRLLALPASQIMEKTGDIFDPNHYLVDTATQVVYRREQFSSRRSLPVELVVRDRRFRADEIQKMFEAEGFEVSEVRCVRAGRWDVPLAETDHAAKEILVLCRKP